MDSQNILIRLASSDDAEALLGIYAPYVRETVITFEYHVPTVLEFRKRIESTLKKYPYLVAESDGQILGYAYAGQFHAREAYDWAVETSIYIDMNYRGCGIGKILYAALEEWLSKQHIVNVNACITYPNPGSIRFHEAFGYKKVAHFTKCGYKHGKWHDMIWMEKMIGEHPDSPENVIWMADRKEDTDDQY